METQSSVWVDSNTGPHTRTASSITRTPSLLALSHFPCSPILGHLCTPPHTHTRVYTHMHTHMGTHTDTVLAPTSADRWFPRVQTPGLGAVSWTLTTAGTAASPVVPRSELASPEPPAAAPWAGLGAAPASCAPRPTPVRPPVPQVSTGPRGAVLPEGSRGQGDRARRERRPHHKATSWQCPGQASLQCHCALCICTFFSVTPQTLSAALVMWAGDPEKGPLRQLLLSCLKGLFEA